MKKNTPHAGPYLARVRSAALAFMATLLALPAGAGINLPREPLHPHRQILPEH